MVEKAYLPFSYQQAQAARIAASLKRIEERKDAVAKGRVIPDSGDLAIGTGRHLDATVLFLDISSFSDIPAGDQAEQHLLMLQLSHFFTEMIRIVQDYDGTVEKNTGDGLMAYFASSDGEPAQTKAVSAALTMMKTADDLLAPAFLKYGLRPFNFRICMDHGPVTIADLGASQRFRGIVAIGTTANIACKMLSLAEPGQILIGEMVVPGLSEFRLRNFIRSTSLISKFVYRSGARYPIYEYIGRWIS